MLYPTEKILLDGDIPVNCYIIQRNKECYVVDPGYQKEKIRMYIQQKQYTVKGILLTHAHIDHIEALNCFDVPVLLHEKEIPVLLNTALNGFDYFGKKPEYDVHALHIQPLKSNDILSVGDKNIEVIFTPGHTQGSVCYRIDHDIYTGDTLFEESVGRWDRPTADLSELKESVYRLMSFPDHYLIHPAHGRSSTILHERMYNPFIKNWNTDTMSNLNF